MKTYVADTPLNSASITPKKDYVILGGGQDAMNVTQTSSRQGKFEARFYHKIFEEEVGRVKGHFGPLNTVAVDPTGKGMFHLPRFNIWGLGLGVGQFRGHCFSAVFGMHPIMLAFVESSMCRIDPFSL